MKNISSVVSTTVLFTLAAASMATNAAQINFTGTVTAQSCELTSGGDLDFNLSTVGVSDVKEPGQQIGMMNLATAISCEDASQAGTVTMAFMPNPGSYEGKVLKNTASVDAAEGVGFVVMDENNQILDFSTGKAEINTPMTDAGMANVTIAANYAKDGSGNEVKPGKVQAILPFVLTYQ
ncbi:fimbrial protein [Aeromonas salmonicida]|uniref:fimbrial protein n=1 Tax=Aeromonas salmonicida TaxID=645 RepID=UPI00259E6294|nr:fimbrial protein [Aeromonas salmonicida]MDM5065433.1 fimbrial protein [Aeromonas salmonicida]